MANNGVITIRFEEGSKTPGPQPIDPSKPTEEAEGINNNSELNTAVMALLLKKAVNQVKSISINEAIYQLHKYFQLTDDYLGRQNMDIALNIINKVWDVGVSIYAGAKIGSKAGWAGAVFGAALAAGVSGVQIAQQISHNYEQERIRINQMDMQLSFNRQRAGYSLTAGSIGENR